MASFRKFCKHEIALNGDWRVALSEINISKKLNNVTDQEFTFFRATEILASKLNAGNQITISKPYYGKSTFIKSELYVFTEKMINEIKTKLEDKFYFDASLQEITISKSIWMNSNKRISIPSHQTIHLLSYNAKLYENDENHFGYNMIFFFDAYYVGTGLYEIHFT